MLRAIAGLFRRAADRGQLSLELQDAAAAPETAEGLRERLRQLGLPHSFSVKLTRNRVTVASFSGEELRVHAAFLGAPPEVWRSLVSFVRARTRAARAAARRELLAYPIAGEPDDVVRRTTRERTHPADERFAAELAAAHARYNTERFGGTLSSVQIRVSRRMRGRLGHYRIRGLPAAPGEIAVSRRHISRDSWEEVLHTLLHEMVHQWQDETGARVDHGARFRAKAREVGITPAAIRRVA